MRQRSRIRLRFVAYIAVGSTLLVWTPTAHALSPDAITNAAGIQLITANGRVSYPYVEANGSIEERSVRKLDVQTSTRIEPLVETLGGSIDVGVSASAIVARAWCCYWEYYGSGYSKFHGGSGASASVAEVSLGFAAVPLVANSVNSRCSISDDHHGAGLASSAGTLVHEWEGTLVDISAVPPNTALPVPGGTLVINEQAYVVHFGGGAMYVDSLVVNALHLYTTSREVIIAHSSCT